MSKYSKISLWYLICIFVALSAAWADGAPMDALIMSGLFATSMVAGIFLAMIIYTKLSTKTHEKR